MTFLQRKLLIPEENNSIYVSSFIGFCVTRGILSHKHRFSPSDTYSFVRVKNHVFLRYIGTRRILRVIFEIKRARLGKTHKRDQVATTTGIPNQPTRRRNTIYTGNARPVVFCENHDFEGTWPTLILMLICEQKSDGLGENT